MSTMLPERWRESLEHIEGKIGGFIEKWWPRRAEQVAESINEELPAAFRNQGGPLLDMEETDKELVVRAELPGLKKEDFSVELAGRRLIIRGEKKISREREGGDGSYFSECRYGSFSRSVDLPYEVDEKDVKADLRNGILTLRLPRPERERSRGHRISIS